MRCSALLSPVSQSTLCRISASFMQRLSVTGILAEKPPSSDQGSGHRIDVEEGRISIIAWGCAVVHAPVPLPALPAWSN